MTGGAQQALRRTMEIYSNTTRFALACNLSSKIIEPIQSRCAVVRFARLTELEILDRLLRVVEAEKVSLGNLSSDSFIDVVESFLLNQLFLCVAQAGS
jgi:DNA polymerase III delta prime subunit